MVDSAIYEAVLAMMESTVPEYTAGGFIRERSGAILPKTAPSNVYPTHSGEMIVMGANQDSVFSRLCDAMQRPELARDPRFVDHVARGENQAELDELISAWSATLDADPLLQRLNDFGVPAGRIYRAPDMLADPHFAARRSIVDVPHPQFEDLKMQDVFPRMSATQGTRALARSAARRAQRRGLRRTAGPRCSDARSARARRRDLTMVSLDDIREAHDRIRPHIRYTPVFTSRAIDELLGAQSHLQVREFAARRIVQDPRRVERGVVVDGGAGGTRCRHTFVRQSRCGARDCRRHPRHSGLHRGADRTRRASSAPRSKVTAAS